MATVSICVPVYNGEKFLAKTIASILNQTYRDFELVIVDNASTDRTAEIIKSFKDPRIRYHRNEKTILTPMNWNRCIELASGDYVALYHADDIYMPNIVASQVALLDKNPAVGVVFTEATTINENDRQIGRIQLPKAMKGKATFTFRELFIQLIRNNYNPLVCPSSMARRSLYAKVLPYDYKSYKYVFDIDMYLRMAEKMDLAVINERLINYRIHPGQGSKKYAGEHRDHNEIYDMYDKFIQRHPDFSSESDLARYDSFKRWDYCVHAMKALLHDNQILAHELSRKSFSKTRILASLTDINLFARLCISLAFYIFLNIGLGKFFATAALGNRLGYL